METFSIHGRFQIFHNNHLRYLRNAIAHFPNAKKLIVGITQPDNTTLVGGSGQPVHRTRLTDNPLTYEQRKEMIVRLIADEIEDSQLEFEITPFPIEDPDADLSKFISTNTIMTLGYCDDWTTQKIAILTSNGYGNICIVQNDSNGDRISGSMIRKKIRSDDSEWLKIVPPSISVYLQDTGLLEVIKKT